jgi:hypothetical protein
MNLNSTASSLNLQSTLNLTIDAGLTLDLDGTSSMTLNSQLINLNNGSQGAARKLDTTVGGPASQQIITGSTTVLIGN